MPELTVAALEGRLDAALLRSPSPKINGTALGLVAAIADRTGQDDDAIIAAANARLNAAAANANLSWVRAAGIEVAVMWREFDPDHAALRFTLPRGLPTEVPRGLAVDGTLEELAALVAAAGQALERARAHLGQAVMLVEDAADTEADADEDESAEGAPLGPCGCVDYHYADCPTRQRAGDGYEPDPYDRYDG